jgi:hypothetical protein
MFPVQWLKEQCHRLRISSAHSKLEKLQPYFFKFVITKWRPHLVLRTVENAIIQVEKGNMRDQPMHRNFGIVSTNVFICL